MNSKLLEIVFPNKTISRSLILLGSLLILLVPLLFQPFRVQLFGQFLAFAIAAVSLNYIWGFAGIMSLGHALFFGLGAYVMGYHLKLQDGMVPEFLMMNGYTEVPGILALLKNPVIALPLIFLIPMVVAFLIGYPTFKAGIKGVYFTILSQAFALGFYLFFINQQTFTGGTSGIYNYMSFFNIRPGKPEIAIPMFYLTFGVLVVIILLLKKTLSTRSGKVLLAIRGGENRLKYLGFNPVPHKIIAFCLSAGIAGIAGGLYAAQVGGAYPTYMSNNYSIQMIIWVAAGGIGTLVGPVVGTIVVSLAGMFFSENLPDFWWFILGAILIAMVFVFPKGFSGTLPGIEKFTQRLWQPKKKSERTGE